MPVSGLALTLTTFIFVISFFPDSFVAAQSLEAGTWTQVFVRECGPPRAGEEFPDCSSGAIQSELRITDADLGVTGSASSAYIKANPLSQSAASAGYSGVGFTPEISAYSYSASGERIITSAVVIQQYEFLSDADLTGSLVLTYSQTGVDETAPFLRSPLGFLLSGVVVFRTENDLFEPEKCGVDDLTTGVALVTCITAEAASQAPPSNNPPGEVYEGALEFVNYELDDVIQQNNATQSIPFSVTGETGDIVFIDADMFIFANNGGFGDSRTTLKIELDNPEVVRAAFDEETIALAPPLSVGIELDILPGSERNPINLGSKGVIPTVIKTTETFDAAQVDISTIAFGPGEAPEAHGRSHVEDVDGDGDSDLILHFNTRASGFACGDREATLTGETFGGERFIGSDRISPKRCR